MEKQKKVLFVVALALGHIGRCLVIADKLIANPSIKVYFAGPSLGLAEKIIPKHYPFTKLAYKEPGDALFAHELESLVNTLQPNVVCLDLTPIPWLIQVNLGNIPQIFITNFFLTQLGELKTLQDEHFALREQEINAFRTRNNLTPFASAREMYERKTVILCDPDFLLPTTKEIPSHYHFVGPCSWESDVSLPEELAGKTNFLLISFGSSGVKPLPYHFAEKLAEQLHVDSIIWMGGKQDHSQYQENPAIKHFFYDWLPASSLLPRAAFVITQGGAGSSYQAMMYGVPIGVWASHRNQWLLGNILQNYGNGVLIESTSDKIQSYLQKNLKTLLEKSQFAKKQLDPINGAAHAAKIISDLIKPN